MTAGSPRGRARPPAPAAVARSAAHHQQRMCPPRCKGAPLGPNGGRARSALRAQAVARCLPALGRLWRSMAVIASGELRLQLSPCEGLCEGLNRWIHWSRNCTLLQGAVSSFFHILEHRSALHIAHYTLRTGAGSVGRAG